MTSAFHRFENPSTIVAPDPKQKIPTAEIRDQTNLSFEYPYLESSSQVTGLNFLEGKTLQVIAEKSFMGTKSETQFLQHNILR